jgi:mRNA interferase RelE/StbE
VTTQLSKYQIAETKTFEKIKKKIDKKLYSKIENFVYPQLRENPFYGTNIKKLKDNLEGYYRYRIGNANSKIKCNFHLTNWPFFD